MTLQPGFRSSWKARATLAVALLALTAGITFPAPATAASGGTLRFERLIEWEGAGADQPFQAFDTHAANAFDLDGDGRLELVSQNDNHRVYVIDAESGRVRAELYNGLPHWWDARDENGVAIGDVNGNGQPDLVIVNSAGSIHVHELEWAEPGGEMKFRKLWNATPDPHDVDPDYQPPSAYGEWSGYPSADGPAFLADVEGSGKQWVFMQADGTAGHFAFDDTGKMRWGKLWGDGNAPPIVTDLDGDGSFEVVYASDNGRIQVYDARSGEHRWNWKLPVWPGSIPVNPAIVDLDGDGKKEILFGGRGVEIVEGTAENGDKTKADPDFDNSSAAFAALEHDGTERWVIQPEWANPVIYMEPVTFDVNDDGVLDVLFLDWNTIGHKPGNWEVTGKANLFAVNGRSGDVLWRTEVDSVWSNKGIILVDVDGDGVPEVLAEEKKANDGISWFDARTGERKGHVDLPAWPWHASRGPLAADFRGDGSVQVVVPVMRPADAAHCAGAEVQVGCREGGFAVYALTAGGAAIWDGGNHLFNADLHKDTTLPGAVPVPGKTPPPEPEPEPEAPAGNDSVPNESVTGNESSFDAAPPDAVPPPATTGGDADGDGVDADATDAPPAGADAREAPTAGALLAALAVAGSALLARARGGARRRP